MEQKTKTQRTKRGALPIPTVPDWLRSKQKITVQQAAALNAISEDTFRRRYRHLIQQIGPRLQAVPLGDALAIGTPIASD
jgi:hypothetical protein